MKAKAVVLGYSGHGYVVIDVLRHKYEVIGYCGFEEAVDNPYKLPYLGLESKPDVQDVLKNHSVFLGMGENKIRAKVFELLTQQGVACPTLIDYSARVSTLATIGQGTTVLPGAIVNACATIGNAVICNSTSVIEHECTIGDYVHIAPGAVLAGNVKVGKYSFIGANAVVKQGITIGSHVIIGAGAVVVNDIPDGCTAYGNPAKIKK